MNLSLIDARDWTRHLQLSNISCDEHNSLPSHRSPIDAGAVFNIQRVIEVPLEFNSDKPIVKDGMTDLNSPMRLSSASSSLLKSEEESLVTVQTRRACLAYCRSCTDCRSLLRQPPTSDITITCEDRTWKCQRAILMQRCDFLKAACGPGFNVVRMLD